MAIQSLSIHGYRGFATRQHIEFAVPNGKKGSGLTAIVGANNSGKSTVIEALQFLSRPELIPPFLSPQRHAAAGGRVEIEYRDQSGLDWRLATGQRGGGPARWHLPEQDSWLGGRVWVVPSRRILEDTTYGRPDAVKDSRTQFLLTRTVSGPRSVRQTLGERVFTASQNCDEFDALFGRIMVPPLRWSVVPLQEGQYNYALVFQAGSTNHPAEGVGEGIISLFWIVDALYDSKPGEIIVIDEPEVSLHPYLQRRLAEVLADYAADRQIIYATHSPYFVDWEAIVAGAQVARVFQRNGGSRIANLSRASVKALGSALRDVHNPHALGLDAREVFFLEDWVILTEGQEDVVTYRSVVKQLGIDLAAVFYGWGVGGVDKMAHIAGLLEELGFEHVAGIIDAGRPRVLASLRKRFPDYTFYEIPARDVRNKKARDKREAVDGLTDARGILKKEYRATTRKMFEALANDMKRPTSTAG